MGGFRTGGLGEGWYGGTVTYMAKEGYMLCRCMFICCKLVVGFGWMNVSEGASAKIVDYRFEQVRLHLDKRRVILKASSI